MARQARGRTLVMIAVLLVGGAAIGAMFLYLRSTESTLELDEDDLITEFGDEPSKVLFQGWPTPELALLVSGQQYGFLEPCGCTERRKGGLGRRHALVEDLQSRRGWPVVGLDLGGLESGRLNKQAEIKLETSLRALQIMNYRAVGLGPEELIFGPRFLESLLVDEQLPRLVSANVRFFDPQSEEPLSYEIIEQGAWKIGVTSLLPKRHADPLQVEDVFWREPSEGLLPILEKLKQADLQVLLAYASLEEVRSLLEQFPDFDVVVCTGGGDAPDDKPTSVGSTMVVQVGHKGMHVGVIGFFGTAEPRLRYQLVELDEHYIETRVMKEFLADYQDRLRDQDVIGHLFKQALEHPSGASFVGAEKCGDCHRKAYLKWLASEHSKAYDLLVQHHHQYDPECVTCHTTGWEQQKVFPYEGGFRSAEETPLLKGNGCENCHGPGSIHVSLEEAKDADPQRREEIRAQMRLTVAWARDNLCTVKCHDLDNSPHFQFEAYWPKVVHPFKD